MSVKSTSSDHPTGFAATALPFWEKLDDGGFEQFCVDLLNLHPAISCLRGGQAVTRRVVSATRLLSGTAQRGADIRADVEGGEVWALQCKRVKDFGPAKVEAAIIDAEKGCPSADQFVLVTTCGLSDEAQGRIRQRQKWLWWDASRLTTEAQMVQPTENGIKLVHRFFGLTWVKNLFPWGDQPLLTWQEFFAEDLSAERHFFHHRAAFVAREEALTKLETFSRNGMGRALMLSAAGGQGKSRLLLELARKLEAEPAAPRVRFLNPAREGLSEEQADFLVREKDLILIVEDAHRLDVTLGAIARTTSRAKGVGLLVATRPQAREAVLSQLHGNGYAERIDGPIDLSRWKHSDMLALAEQVLDLAHHLNAPRLARLADLCPLLVVMGAALINRGSLPDAVTDEEEFRERVFKGFVDELLQRQDVGKRDRIRRLIQVLAFVSPVQKELLQPKAAEINSCSVLDVADDLKTIHAAGLLVQNRQGIRLYPDLFADAVLLDACIDRSGEKSFLWRTVVEKLPISDFPALMRNLAQADWEARTNKNTNHSLFDPIWEQFVSRFERANWSDRGSLLRQWASFAIFQPTRTLELAALAIAASDPLSPDPEFDGFGFGPTGRSEMVREIPAMLLPIVWHQAHTRSALDLLWALDKPQAPEPHAPVPHSVTVIATAASFGVDKPLAISESVLAWLELTLSRPDAVQRIRCQPSIFSALMDPFFERVVDQSWSTEHNYTVRSLPILVEVTRPLRHRALKLVEQFSCSGEIALTAAAIPLLREAIRPIQSKFRFEPTADLYQQWQPDRMEALALAERSVVANKNPLCLLQIRNMLRDRAQFDPDPAVVQECKRILSLVPDSIELRLARVLTSWAHDEVDIPPGPNVQAESNKAAGEWAAFCRKVADELVTLTGTVKAFCSFVRRALQELGEAGIRAEPSTFADAVAALSPAWCSSLLDELIVAPDDALDGFLWAALREAMALAPESYHKALDFLPLSGRPQQVCVLVQFLASKYLQGGGLTQFERDVILKTTQRRESAVVRSLASAITHYFMTEMTWATPLLGLLKPAAEVDSTAVLEALARLAAMNSGELDSEVVTRCFSNVGEFCLAHEVSEHRYLQTIAKKFPQQVYEHFRKLLDQPGGAREKLSFRDLPPLGPFQDSTYLAEQIQIQWEKVLGGGDDQQARMAMLRLLLWSDLASAPDRFHKLLAECNSDEQILLATKLAARQGSLFAFQFPELVREILTRGTGLSVLPKIRETLLLSACGGGRSFVGGESTESRYIFEQTRSLAARFRSDPILAPFYALIIQYEEKQTEFYHQMFPNDDDE